MAMAHKWTAEDFCHELQHVANLLVKRPNSQMGEACLVSLKQRLTNVTDMTASTLSALYDKVEAAELPQNIKDDILQTMDSLSVSTESNLQLETKASSLHCLPPYLTTADWKALSQCHVLDAMRIISERMEKLGIKSMKEETKKTAVATLLHLHVTVHKNPLPCAWTIYGMVVDLAQVFNHTEVGQSVPGLKMYPSSPSQLAKDWLKKAYGNEEPSMSDLSVATFYPKIPLRSTSSLLWAEAPAHCKHLQKGNAKKEQADPLMSKLNDFMEKWDSKQDQEKLQNMQHSRMNPLPLQNTGQQAMSGLPGWPVQPSAGSRPDHAGPLPLQNGTPAAEAVETKANDKPSLEEIETKAWEALQKKRSNAKAKSQPASKNGNKKKVLKRPAASSSTVLTRASVQRVNKIYGCTRCRGNVKGCTQCWDDTFTGKRFSSREEWKEWAKQNNKK